MLDGKRKDIEVISLLYDRCFHTSSQVWARSGETFGLKTPKKEKYVRKESRNQPPVEAPYVPRNVTATKSNPVKTVEIFEGMTLVELAKRTGKSVSSLQDILTNVGEKVGSEFEPLSMDISELVALVFPPFKPVNIGNWYLLLIPFLVRWSFPFVNGYFLRKYHIPHFTHSSLSVYI